LRNASISRKRKTEKRGKSKSSDLADEHADPRSRVMVTRPREEVMLPNWIPEGARGMSYNELGKYCGVEPAGDVETRAGPLLG
jgi:hypothetical protein